MFYRVTWVCEFDAESPREAAEMAKAVMLDPDSLAQHFEVQDADTLETVMVDLTEPDEPPSDLLATEGPWSGGFAANH